MLNEHQFIAAYKQGNNNENVKYYTEMHSQKILMRNRYVTLLQRYYKIIDFGMYLRHMQICAFALPYNEITHIKVAKVT